LGIFGREDVYLANYWTSPADQSPGYWAWRMFRNYDGAASTFGDISISASSSASNANVFSTYASKDSASGEGKILLLNKLPSTTETVAVNFANFSATAAKVYQYAQADSTQIKRLADLTGLGGTAHLTLPAYSITLLVLAPATGGGTGTPTPPATVTTIG